MKKALKFYLGHAKLIGGLYCAVPTIFLYAAFFIAVPFRGVYLVRLVLSLIAGSAAGAYFNELGLNLWLAKHSSNKGPATLAEGAYNGAAIGAGTALIPALAVFIGTNHIEAAKTIFISLCLSSAFTGAVFGTVLAAIARSYMARDLQ